MPTLEAEISSIVQGDGVDITVNIGKVTGDFVGDAVTKVWFTVKNSASDTDANALFQKVITGTNVPGTGVILDDGSVSGTAQVRVELVNADTSLLTNPKKAYPFDLQVETTNGGATKPYTPWLGHIKPYAERTRATS